MIDLKQGIKFEDNNVLLEWGKPIDKIPGFIKRDKGDRTIFDWGRHVILNGLELDLISKYWNFGKERKNRKFLSIQHWSEGDIVAIDSFDKISKHLLIQFGEPTTKDDSNLPERSWEWNVDGGHIHLYLFEQHAYKLSMSISQLL